MAQFKVSAKAKIISNYVICDRALTGQLLSRQNPQQNWLKLNGIFYYSVCRDKLGKESYACKCMIGQIMHEGEEQINIKGQIILLHYKYYTIMKHFHLSSTARGSHSYLTHFLQNICFNPSSKSFFELVIC